MLKVIGYAFLGALGNRQALGALERIKTKQAVRRDWQRARGRYGWKPTLGNIQRFLEVSYGFEWEPDGNLDAPLNSAQLDQVLDAIAPELLAAGMAEWSGKSD